MVLRRHPLGHSTKSKSSKQRKSSQAKTSSIYCLPGQPLYYGMEQSKAKASKASFSERLYSFSDRSTSICVNLGCISRLGKNGVHFSAFDDPNIKKSTFIPEYHYDVAIVVLLQNIGSTFRPESEASITKEVLLSFFFEFSYACLL